MSDEDKVSDEELEPIKAGFELMVEHGIKMKIVRRGKEFDCKWKDKFYADNEVYRAPGTTMSAAARGAWLCANHYRIGLGKAELPDCFST